MQPIFAIGKSYMYVSLVYFPNFVDGTQYDLVFESQKCNKDKSVATAFLCGDKIRLDFSLNRCLQIEVYKISIYEKDTQNLLHKLEVQVCNYSKN